LRRLSLCLGLFLILRFTAGCAVTSSTGASSLPVAAISVSVVPGTANIRTGSSQSFTAVVSGSTNQAVQWSVNGSVGGNASVGTIDAAGKYTAPAALPNPNSITILGTAAADAKASGSSKVTLLNPAPTLSKVSPASFTAGAYTLTISGSNFVAGSQVLFGGTSVTTKYVSPSQLTATGAISTAGMYSVSVSNPDPGSSVSAGLNVTVTAMSGGNPPPTPPPPPPPNPSACSAMSLGQGGSLNGFVPFPADNGWNLNIANAPVDPNSAAIINFIGGTAAVHADFGAGQYQGSTIGIPYVVVGAGQALVAINFTAYGDESDPGPMPVPANAQIEGYPNPGTGDRHVLVLDNSNCFLYELYNSYPQGDGSWNADSAAVWDLLRDEQRPFGWTSADAAGLSIFAGLARYDEVAAGEIKHALRYTLQHSRAAFVPPASHWAANSTNANAAPMGMRLRLKASFDISEFSAANQVILKGLQQYGMLMADNGSNMYISGAPDDRWDNDDLHNLGQLTASDFEVVAMNPIYTQAHLPGGAAPSIASFSASAASVSAGTSVTLQWQVSGASYLTIAPQVSAIRGTSLMVTPLATTTYTLSATNPFGRTTSTVTVTVK
jgi:hypothetical protein